MATGFDLRLPQPLDCANLAKEWPRWKQAFGIYLRANNKMSESEENKIAVFLWLIGPRGVEIFNTLYPEKASADNLFGIGGNDEDAAFGDAVENVVNEQVLTLADVIASFDDYCLPRKNIAMEAFKFNTIAQKERQTFTEFETELRTQIQYCEFKCHQCQTSYSDRMLRDRIIIGIQDKKLQMKLLDGRDDPLTKIFETCKVFEAALENKLILDRKVNSLEIKPVESQLDKGQKEIAAITRKHCFNCGRPFNQNHRRSCPAVNVKCFACGGAGHFSKCCRRKLEKEENNTKQPMKPEPFNKPKSVLTVNWSDAE
ncbi:uncharacterized protein LOC131680680 [Topomyia yanbarensis]|uniref:uncharacterized protein LOC131680680 n=1 Tax=Topomyia yanbarensis TaxID=2498891 RepID=UPI00273BE94A|nr:uncharacterized protein LOC131680680 [Topomyia yanbarensis]